MALRRKKPSLAEKIGNLVTAAPTIFSSDDENEQTKAKVVDPYDEADVSDVDQSLSIIRRRNVDLLDEIDDRYKGQKVSRRDVYQSENDSDAENPISDKTQSSEDSHSMDEESEEDAEMASDVNESESDADMASDVNESESDAEMASDGNESDSDAEKASDGDESDSDAAEDSEIDEDNPLRRDRDEQIDFNSVMRTNVHADIQKGNCIREQLKIWENLLETRIKLQKCLITSNKMPQKEAYRRMKEDKNFKKNVNEGTNKLSCLLENLLDLQANLLKNYPETRDLSKKEEKRNAAQSPENEDSDEEICSDTEEENDLETNSKEVGSSEEENEEKEKTPPCKKKKRTLAEYENLLAANHERYRDYRNSVIQKWNDRTRVATGSLNKGSSQSIVKQIEFVLGDREKLLQRTRLKRSEYEIVGKEETPQNEDGRRQQEYDSEIYDDDDFYHQLLRELIEYKSSDITDPVQLSKQWISLQNMRNKMKRKIDTRATKGRRIRYNVHTKLVNYMAPVTVNDTWSDLAKNELYNSLFGKIKSTTVTG